MARDINTLIDSAKKAKAALEAAFEALESLGDEAKAWPGEISRVVPASLTKNMQSVANAAEGPGQESLKNLIEFLSNLPVKAFSDNPVPIGDKIRQMASNQAPIEALGTGAPESSQPMSAIAAAREAVGIDGFINKNAKRNFDSSIGGIDLNRLAEAGVGADREGIPQLRELMADIQNKPENVRETITKADRALEESSGPVDLNDFVRSSIRSRTNNDIGGFSFNQLKENGVGVRDDFMSEFPLKDAKKTARGSLNEIASKVAAAQKDRRLSERVPEFIREPEVPPKEVLSADEFFDDEEVEVEGQLNWGDLAEAPGSIDAIPDFNSLADMEIVDPVANAMNGVF
jgi:hypothetical protein